MDQERSEPAEGPVGRLLKSAGGFLASLLAIGRTRLELLTVELQLELRRIAGFLVLGFVAVLAAAMALLMAGIAVIVAFWDTHRLLAALGVTLTFLLVAGGALGLLVRGIRAHPRLLEGTLAELSRDVEQLRGRG